MIANAVERFFRDLDAKRLRRGVFQSVPELIDAVMSCVGGHDDVSQSLIHCGRSSGDGRWNATVSTSATRNMGTRAAPWQSPIRTRLIARQSGALGNDEAPPSCWIFCWTVDSMASDNFPGFAGRQEEKRESKLAIEPEARFDADSHTVHHIHCAASRWPVHSYRIEGSPLP